MKKIALHKLTGKQYLYHDEDGTDAKVKEALHEALSQHDHVVVSMKDILSMTGRFTQEVFMDLHNQYESTIEFVDANTHQLDTLRVEASFPPNPTEFVITGVLTPYDTAYAKLYKMNRHTTWTYWHSREEAVPAIGDDISKLKRWATRVLTDEFHHPSDTFNDWKDDPEHVEEVGCKSAYRRVSKSGELMLILEVR